MCTVVVDFDPTARVPLMLAGVRDEMVDRAWVGPGRHWPGHPELIGGRDTQAGGTWLAVNTGEHGSGQRVAAVLNGRLHAGGTRGRTPVVDSTVPSGQRRRSRGELPLLAAANGGLSLPAEQLTAFDPFHLLCADARGAVLVSWDGREILENALPVGTTVIVNTGLDPGEPRAARFAPVFEAARPDPGAVRLERARTATEIWGDWVATLDEAGAVRPAAPHALVTRVDLGGGRVWASTSVSLVAMAPGVARYAFTDAPGDSTAWRMVR